MQTGYLDMRDLYRVRTRLPALMDYPDVGGITPPRGRRLPPFVGPRPHPSPYGPPARRDREFPNPHVPLQAMRWISMMTTTEPEMTELDHDTSSM